MNSNTYNHENGDACCNTHRLEFNVCQSLSEMEFERGIWYAAQNNDIDRVMTLLQKGISSNIEDSAGYTALHYAARNGHYKICKILLENNANVNAYTRCGHATPLHRAASLGHKDIVDILLNFGADINITDNDGFTALHRAILSESIPVCRLLLTKTKLDIVNNAGLTPLQLAIKKENQVIISMFKNK